MQSILERPTGNQLHAIDATPYDLSSYADYSSDRVTATKPLNWFSSTFGRRNTKRYLSRPIVGSPAGWAIIDFAAGVICGSYAAFLSYRNVADSQPRSLAEVIGCGLLFGCLVGLFSHLSFIRHSIKEPQIAPEFLLLLKDVALAALVVSVLLTLLGTGPISQSAIETEICSAMCLMTLARILWRWHRVRHRRRGVAIRNFVIAGLGPLGDNVRDYLSSLNYAGYKFKGFVSLDESDLSLTSPSDEILGSITDVMPLARSIFVDEIFFISRPDPRTLKIALDQARSAGIDVRVIPGISETLEPNTDVHYIGDLPTVVLHQVDSQDLSRFFKRLLDICGALLALILLLPVFLVIAILIKIDSSGPIFYVSERVGLKGRTFRCVKFRTMVRNAQALRAQLTRLNERDGILFKMSNDPRITRAGALLRKYSLDELPQFWNVLCGQMSLVGPRPPIQSEVEQYEIDHFCRLEVMPGITGLWQVEARQDPAFQTYIDLDRKYVNDWSIGLDLSILFRTFGVVVRGTGT